MSSTTFSSFSNSYFRHWKHDGGHIYLWWRISCCEIYFICCETSEWPDFSVKFLKWRDKSRMSAIHLILSFSILFVAWLYFCFGLFMKIQETGHESVLIVLSLYSFPLILRLELEQTCIIMYKHHNVKEQIWKTKKWNDFSSFSHTLSCLHT